MGCCCRRRRRFQNELVDEKTELATKRRRRPTATTAGRRRDAAEEKCENEKEEEEKKKGRNDFQTCNLLASSFIPAFFHFAKFDCSLAHSLTRTQLGHAPGGQEGRRTVFAPHIFTICSSSSRKRRYVFLTPVG
jgi:hypothetical protein